MEDFQTSGQHHYLQSEPGLQQNHYIKSTFTTIVFFPKLWMKHNLRFITTIYFKIIILTISLILDCCFSSIRLLILLYLYLKCTL